METATVFIDCPDRFCLMASINHSHRDQVGKGRHLEHAVLFGRPSGIASIEFFSTQTRLLFSTESPCGRQTQKV